MCDRTQRGGGGGRGSTKGSKREGNNSNDEREQRVAGRKEGKMKEKLRRQK